MSHRSAGRRSSRVLAHAVAALLLTAATEASATPSSTFWTPASVGVQPFAVPHLTYDTWFAEQGALQVATGLTVGVVRLPRLEVEAGVDFFEPTLTARGQLGTLDFVQANAKLVYRVDDGPESSTLSLGIANAGFKRDVSDYHTLYATYGSRTRLGAFAFGGYYGLGSPWLWTRMEGEMRGGALGSWVSPDWKIGAAGLDRIVFMADVAAGKNWLGGAGAAVALFFTPAIAVKTGPVLLLDRDLYANSGLPGWLWSVQLDVDVDLTRKREAPAAPVAAPAPPSAGPEPAPAAAP